MSRETQAGHQTRAAQSLVVDTHPLTRADAPLIIGLARRSFASTDWTH
jgi:hypothetical protein